MSLFFILLLLALIAGGVYVYQRLVTIEREIRAEQAALKEEESRPEVKHEVSAQTDSATLVSDADLSLETRIIELVEQTPGMTQTELYGEFSDGERREIQKLLRELDQQGLLRREKKGSSYRLHPL